MGDLKWYWDFKRNSNHHKIIVVKITIMLNELKIAKVIIKYI